MDPFTSVSSIERYLLERGIGIPGQAGSQQQPGSDDGDEDSEISEEDQVSAEEEDKKSLPLNHFI